MKFPLLNYLNNSFTSHASGSCLLVLVLAVGSFAPVAFAQKTIEISDATLMLAVPTPVVVSGNPTCATLNASTDPAFSHITEDWGLKINRDGKTPFTETFTFVNGPDTELQGGAGPSPSSFVTADVNGTTLSWHSNRLITAVIVKGGSLGANVYPYNPSSLGGFPNGDGTGLNTGNQNNISHFVFCFQSLEPSAAPASVGGRVTDSFGRGISGARIAVLDAQSGATWTTITSPFGYYQVDELAVGGFYIISVSHKRYNFADSTRAFTLNDDLFGIDFVANP